MVGLGPVSPRDKSIRIPRDPRPADFCIRLGSLKGIGGAEWVLDDLLLLAGALPSVGSNLDPLICIGVCPWPLLPDFRAVDEDRL